MGNLFNEYTLQNYSIIIALSAFSVCFGSMWQLVASLRRQKRQQNDRKQLGRTVFLVKTVPPVVVPFLFLEFCFLNSVFK